MNLNRVFILGNVVAPPEARMTPSGQTVIQQSKISGNSASEQGGGIWSGGGKTAGIETTTIQGNNALAGADCLGILIFKGKLNNLGDPKGCTTLGPKTQEKPTVRVPTIIGTGRSPNIGKEKGASRTTPKATLNTKSVKPGSGKVKIEKIPTPGIETSTIGGKKEK